MNALDTQCHNSMYIRLPPAQEILPLLNDDDDGNGDDEDDDKECKMTASMTTPTIGWWIVKNNDKIGLFPTLYSQEFGSEGNLYKSVPEGHKGTGVSSSKG